MGMGKSTMKSSSRWWCPNKSTSFLLSSSLFYCVLFFSVFLLFYIHRHSTHQANRWRCRRIWSGMVSTWSTVIPHVADVFELLSIHCFSLSSLIFPVLLMQVNANPSLQHTHTHILVAILSLSDSPFEAIKPFFKFQSFMKLLFSKSTGSCRCSWFDPWMALNSGPWSWSKESCKVDMDCLKCVGRGASTDRFNPWPYQFYIHDEYFWHSSPFVISTHKVGDERLTGITKRCMWRWSGTTSFLDKDARWPGSVPGPYL